MPVKQAYSSLFIGIAFLAISACVTRALQQPVEGPYTLKVTISGLHCCQGSLRLAVYNSDTAWMRDNAMVRGRIIIVQKDTELIEIHGLAKGEYAIAVFQDINGNGKLDRWFWFLPREPYGFSNNGERFGPVSFARAAVLVPEVSELDIRMRTIGGR